MKTALLETCLLKQRMGLSFGNSPGTWEGLLARLRQGLFLERPVLALFMAALTPHG